MTGVLLLLLGFVVMVVGIAVWSWQLAIVVAGIELCVVAMLYSRGADGTGQ